MTIQIGVCVRDDAGAGDITDADLVVRAGRGDRTAFGMLYLRHHLAAWRIATVASGFSDDAEVAVIDGFTNVFSAMPAIDLADHDIEFRRHLVVCVRRIALDRILPRRMPMEPLDSDVDGGAPGVGLLRSALRVLPEPSRTVLWLSEVEGWAVADVAATLGLDLSEVDTLLVDAGDSFRQHCRRALRKRRPLTSPRLEIGPGLAMAVPPVPALGGECQRRWLRERAMHASLTGSGHGF